QTSLATVIQASRGEGLAQDRDRPVAGMYKAAQLVLASARTREHRAAEAVRAGLVVREPEPADRESAGWRPERRAAVAVEASGAWMDSCVRVLGSEYGVPSTE